MICVLVGHRPTDFLPGGCQPPPTAIEVHFQLPQGSFLKKKIMHSGPLLLSWSICRGRLSDKVKVGIVWMLAGVQVEGYLPWAPVHLSHPSAGARAPLLLGRAPSLRHTGPLPAERLCSCNLCPGLGAECMKVQKSVKDDRASST